MFNSLIIHPQNSTSSSKATHNYGALNCMNVIGYQSKYPHINMVVGGVPAIAATVIFKSYENNKHENNAKPLE